MTIITKGKDTIIVGGSTKIVSGSLTMTATKGNLVLNSTKQIIVQGKKEKISYGNYVKPLLKEKNITEIFWMNASMEKRISDARTNESLSLRIKTENYELNEMITIVVKEQENESKNIQLVGFVQEDGYAYLKEAMYVDEINFNKNHDIA